MKKTELDSKIEGCVPLAAGRDKLSMKSCDLDDDDIDEFTLNQLEELGEAKKQYQDTILNCEI